MSTGLPSSSLVWIVVLTALALAALLLGLEWKRGRNRTTTTRALRLLTTLAVVLALAWLAFRPMRWLPTDTRAAVLLTSADSQNLLDQTSDAPQPALRLSLPRAAGDPNSVPIPDAAYIPRHFPDLARIEVVGHGLDDWELDSLTPKISFRSAPPTGSGPESVSWQRELTLGDPLWVQGTWQAPSTARRLELVGPGGVEASREIEADSASNAHEALRSIAFTFETQPRTDGRLLYRLRLISEDETQEAPIDVVVREPKGPRLLWLESAPRFETRHFKNWLSTLGGSLAIRSTISRARFRRETFGRAAIAPSRITADTIRGYDLVVLDRGIVNSLNAAEVAALREEVTERGLGLLLLPYGEDAPNRSSLRRLGLDVASRPVGDLADWSARVSWQLQDADSDENQASAPPLLIPAREWIMEPGIEASLTDINARVIAARRALGLGQVGVTVLADSFRWILEGAAEHHERYWSQLLSELARPLSAERWALPAGPVLLHRPLSVTLWSAEGSPSASVVTPSGEVLPLALAQALDEPHRWRGQLWPRQTGWHQLRTNHAATLGDTAAPQPGWFHAQEARPWQSWIEVNRRQATARRAAEDLERATTAPLTATQRVPRTLPRWPAFALLVLGLGYLWTDERLRG